MPGVFCFCWRGESVRERNAIGSEAYVSGRKGALVDGLFFAQRKEEGRGEIYVVVY